MQISNSYEDPRRAETYAALEFPGTYYLAYRDLPQIFASHADRADKALDFGCGTGRSTRFLKRYGFDALGVDISPDMIEKAGELDPSGDYRLIADGDFSQFEDNSFDLVLSVFTFDNIPTLEQKVRNFSGLRRLLKPGGRLVNLVSSPEIYTHEWASFSTRDFPENKYAKCGDKVRIVITATADERPVEDVVWPDADYRRLFEMTGLEVAAVYKPLAREDEPFEWVNEIKIAPWVIYVINKVQPPS